HSQHRQVLTYLLLQKTILFLTFYEYLNRLFQNSNAHAVIQAGANTYYFHTDHLGSSSIITDATGNKVEEIYYYPFGGTRLNQGSVNVKHKVQT
ncbi:MAG: hypothetical protein M0Z70_11470, partial [Nitrospiraceae bacterium]|nr:hypothetical protein [Nitrospirota bacterium]MDA8339906.1 hypothetical protein [Nitrospiraceae bacterium]